MSGEEVLAVVALAGGIDFFNKIELIADDVVVAVAAGVDGDLYALIEDCC